MNEYNEFDDCQNEESYEQETNRRNPRIILAIVITILVLSMGNALLKLGNYCIDTYNELVDLQEEAKKEQGNVEAAMQRRIELIPDLVKVASKAAEHKEKIFEEVTSASENLKEAITGGNLEEIENANYDFSIAINRLIEYSRKDPQIYATREFSSLMSQLESSVNRINVQRFNYNEVVTEYNKKVRNFPGALIAKFFGFETMSQFEADDAAKEQINLVEF